MDKFKIGDKVKVNGVQRFSRFDEGVIESYANNQYYVVLQNPFDNIEVGRFFKESELILVSTALEVSQDPTTKSLDYDSMKKALNNAIDEIKDLKEQLEYTDKQLELIANSSDKKDELIRELSELLISNTNQ